MIMSFSFQCYLQLQSYLVFQTSYPIKLIKTRMIGLIVTAAIFSILFFLIASVCLCMGCLGLSSHLFGFIDKCLSRCMDKPYSKNDSPINLECFICLEEVKDEVVATCNHSYCGQCMLDYLKAESDKEKVKCPACRKQILLLFRRFQPKTTHQKAIRKYICDFNYKYSKEPGFFRSLYEFTTNFKNLPNYLSTNGVRYLLQNSRIKYMIMMALYTLSPIDLMPEAMLGPIGLSDDLFVMMNLVRQTTQLIRQFVRDETLIEGRQE